MADNNVYSPIPARLHSVATEGVVSGADEIFDDAKGKRQSVINQETDASLDNKYDKDETYSKQELNNLITTPNQDYVTVPTYGSLPATGEADTVYRVSNYDGEQSQVDATKYSEYAWDGTQYVFLCVKTQIGEVFDITAYNSNTKYADLTAALGTGGANIPEGLRKGGMSVKYVQSSDNKYVQYRLMSDTFNTTVTNWQGIDNIPTPCSKNLTESGGIAKSINNIIFEGQDNTFVYIDIDWMIAGHTYLIAFRKVWDASSVTDTGSRFLIDNYYNNNNTHLEYVTNLSTLKDYYKIVVPDNSDFIRIGGRGNADSILQLSVQDITDYDNISIATGYAYFSGPSYPEFKLNANNNSVLEITLPNAALRLYNLTNKLLYEFDCSTLQNRNFSLESTQCLLYDIINNTIRVAAFNASLTNCIILLGSSGGSLKGAIWGLLSPYYYKFLNVTNREDTELLNNLIDALSSHTGNIDVTNNIITINYGIQFVANGIKYSANLTDKTLQTLDNPSGTRVVYTYCYIDKYALKDSDTDNLFLVTSTLQTKSQYLLFACWYYSTLTCGGIVGRLNNPKLEALDKNIDTKISIAYFTNATFPDFVQDMVTTSQVRVILPPATLRLYSQTGVILYECDCTQLQSREFTVGSTGKLVYDTSNNTIKTVSATQNSKNFVTLLSLMGSYRTRGAVTGLLQGYYFASVLTSQENLIKSIDDVNRWSDLRLLFFSDVHAATDNVSRIINMANRLKANSQLDCVINGGDTVNNIASEGLSWYNAIVDGSNVPVLTVPGNHDCWSNASTWTWTSAIDVYNLVIAKVVQQASISEYNYGETYYYKDFGNIRIICITAMQSGDNELYFDATQKQWLQDVLNSARTTYHYVKAANGVYNDYTLVEGDTITGTYANIAMLNDIEYVNNAIYAIPMSVIIVNHSPYANPKRIESNKINSFIHYDEQNCRTKGIVFDTLKLAASAITIVDSYIQAGGSFICWLTGHTHFDNVMVELEHTNQLMININSANNSKKVDGVAITNKGWYDYDSYNYIGFDVKSGLIKVLRIGWHNDSSMRCRESWCYDYVHQKLMSEN